MENISKINLDNNKIKYNELNVLAVLQLEAYH